MAGISIENAAKVLGKLTGIRGADDGAFNYRAVSEEEQRDAIRVGFAALALMHANQKAMDSRGPYRGPLFKRVDERRADLRAAIRGLPMQLERP